MAEILFLTRIIFCFLCWHVHLVNLKNKNKTLGTKVFSLVKELSFLKLQLFSFMFILIYFIFVLIKWKIKCCFSGTHNPMFKA